MNGVFIFIKTFDFLASLWLFPLVFTIHELEEWNIVGWYQRYYVDLPPMTASSARAWLVFISAISFLWVAVATLPGNVTLAAWLFLPFAVVALLNALQHIYWLFLFKAYDPGVISALVLLLPVSLYLVVRAISYSLVPTVAIAVLLLPIIVGFIQTIKAGNSMLAPIRGIHHFGMTLSTLLGLEKHQERMQ